MNLLCWNLGGNDGSALLAECISECAVDIAVFSEWGPTDLHEVASSLGGSYSVLEGMGGCEKIRMMVRSGIGPKYCMEQSRYAAYLMESDSIKFIVVGVHLPDRWTLPEPDCRLRVIRRLMEGVNEMWKAASCGNVIIAGDLNADPWDKELLPDAFNSVLFKDVIRGRGTRRWFGQEFGLLYNPVLDWISEATGSYGSYYTSSPDATTYWRCLDQVLVSRSLVEGIEDLRYLRSIGHRSLMAKVRPDGSISDHLPLLVQIDLGCAREGEQGMDEKGNLWELVFEDDEGYEETAWIEGYLCGQANSLKEMADGSVWGDYHPLENGCA